ncbi:MAG: hypothetical protein JXM70_14060 [Pirellulales bacterium]|nr:hypothetical protein [Pirellulales bacterium]
MAVPWHYKGCTCKHYVQATLCAGESDPGYGVYVHEDDLPETGTGFFKYGGLCWYVSAGGTRVCWPKTGQRAYPVYPFDDCDDCTSDTGGDTAGGTGGGNDGPYDGGGMGGWWGPWEWPEPTEPTAAQTKYRQLVPCTTGDNSIFIKVAVKDSTEYGPDVGSVTRLNGNRCYYVGSTLYSDLPGGGKVLYPSFPYDSCPECTNGLQAHLCPDYQQYSAEAPDVWIAHEGVSEMTATRYFRYAGYCYYVDPTDSEAVIPADAVLLSEAYDEYDNCAACGPGRQATLCPDQTAPDYDVWVLEDDLPASGSIVWKHSNGLCYSIDAGTTSMTPPDAHIAVPGTPYASCAACLCGLPIEGVQAAKVELCGGQDSSVIKNARDWWIKQADLPAVAMVWAIDGVCVRAYPTMPLRDAPADAEFVKPVAMYDSCFQCSFYNAGDDGGGGSVPLPPPYNSPPNDGPVGPPPSTVVCRRWIDCADDSLTDVYCDRMEIPGKTQMAMMPSVNVSAPGGGVGLSTDKCYWASDGTIPDNEEVGPGLYLKSKLLPGSIPNFPKRRFWGGCGCPECNEEPVTCHECGDCCFSDQSLITFTKPTATWVGSDTFYRDAAIAYNALSTTSLLIGIGEFVVWAASAGGGASVAANKYCDSSVWVVDAWYNAKGLFFIDGFSLDTCCAFSGGTVVDQTGGEISWSGTVTGYVEENNCCKSNGECIAIDTDYCSDCTTCDGDCETGDLP